MTRSRVKNDFAVGIDDNAASTALTVDASQNVGIGASSSLSRLTVAEGTTANLTIRGATAIDTDGRVIGALNFEEPEGTGDGTLAVEAAVKGLRSGADSFNSGGHLTFFTRPFNGSLTERMRILSSGGITFNGDTAAANALDDYEEGIWTPVVGSATTASTVSYTLQKGYYTKIGNRVFYSLYMNFDVTTAGTGFFYASLPFTVVNGHTFAAASIAYQNVFTVATGYHLGCYTEQNATRIYFTQNNSLQGAPVSGARTLMVSGHYQV